MMLSPSGNYRYDTEDPFRTWEEGRGSVQVPTLRPVEDYLQVRMEEKHRAYADARRHERGRVHGLREHALASAADVSLRVSTIYWVGLHPAYDHIYTGGPVGGTDLTEFPDLPPKLEEYTDEDLLILLARRLYIPEEVREIRGFERTLRGADPSYRRYLPKPLKAT